MKPLDGHRTVEAEVERAPDVPGAACAEGLVEAVAASDGRRHGSRSVAGICACRRRRGDLYREPMRLHLLVLPAVALAVGLVNAGTAAAKTDCYADGAPVCVRAAVTGNDSVAGSFKPKRIATLEYTVPITGIKWTTWTRTKAVGKGTLQRCGACVGFDGAKVTITLSRPIEYFCGPSEEELESIGTWFTRATLKSAVGVNGIRRVLDDGHPNAC
jgi:hypothetical protein